MGASRTEAGLEVPGVGMRGGLGRTLLTAFLCMTIVPLSLVSWYAAQRSRLNIQEEVTGKLTSIAALKEAQISRWVEGQAAVLAAPESDLQPEVALSALEAGPEEVRLLLEGVALRWGAADVALLGPEGLVEWASDAAWEGAVLSLPGSPTPAVVETSLGPGEQAGLVLVGPFDGGTRWPYVAARFSLQGLARIVEETAGLGQTGEAYLVDSSGMAYPQRQRLSSSAVQDALLGREGRGLYENYAALPVIGVYRWLPAFDLALIVEQSQEEAFAGNDTVVAAVIAITLGVALVTAVIAAIVTRQITRPVVNLTESALRIATGDLSQRVEVTSRDEIGILAEVFNRMTAELQVLYDELEAKVAERTRLLQRANYQIQRRAIQLQTSLEVGQAVTSILEPDRLLKQVVQVVRDRFVYSYVAAYTADEKEGRLLLRAAAGDADPLQADLPEPVERAFARRMAVVESRPVTLAVGPPTSYTRSEVALPLCLGSHTLGVLDVQTTDQEGFDQDEVSVLQNVANQVSIALENARAYALEYEAVRRLRELDRSKRLFLTNMSRELRTPLTNIIGFSRLLLKEMSGPLTEQQRSDLQRIYHNGQHLLGLINDLLDISQIEAGLMELEFREVDLAELIRSVLSTAGALVKDKSVELREEIAPDLPMVQVDPARIRQVLLRLLANGIKFTEEGTVTLRAWSTDGRVLVSVSDTGVGIPEEDLERIFVQDVLENDHRANGASLGLALSKEFVEMHGGEIWVESRAGEGATFTFTLPIKPVSSADAGLRERY